MYGWYRVTVTATHQRVCVNATDTTFWSVYCNSINNLSKYQDLVMMQYLRFSREGPSSHSSQNIASPEFEIDSICFQVLAQQAIRQNGTDKKHEECQSYPIFLPRAKQRSHKHCFVSTIPLVIHNALKTISSSQMIIMSMTLDLLFQVYSLHLIPMFPI